MRREVDAKRVPGVTMLISRCGKVAYRESVGRLRPTSGHALDASSALFDDQADSSRSPP